MLLEELENGHDMNGECTQRDGIFCIEGYDICLLAV